MIIKGTISFGSYLMNPLQLYLLHKECVALLIQWCIVTQNALGLPEDGCSIIHYQSEGIII